MKIRSDHEGNCAAQRLAHSKGLLLRLGMALEYMEAADSQPWSKGRRGLGEFSDMELY